MDIEHGLYPGLSKLSFSLHSTGIHLIQLPANGRRMAQVLGALKPETT